MKEFEFSVYLRDRYTWIVQADTLAEAAVKFEALREEGDTADVIVGDGYLDGPEVFENGVDVTEQYNALPEEGEEDQ